MAVIRGGKCADPAWRHARAMKAGAAAREAYHRRGMARAERYADKAMAWAAGYRRGFVSAARWWRAKYHRDICKHKE